MKKPIKIGEKEYNSKKEALTHYKDILNSYEFGQSLSDDNYSDLIDLLDYDYKCYVLKINDSESEDQEEDTLAIVSEEKDDEVSFEIEDIKVSKVQFNTKCFEVLFNDNTSQYISYLMIINQKGYTSESLFMVACRNSVHKDIRAVKQKYFDENSKQGLVKCQETNQLSKWTELVIDHRQPNTFSVIVDRFKEVFKIDLNTTEYVTNDENMILFSDQKITDDFVKYHSDKANLRLVRKKLNSGRSGLARVKRSTKDLSIE